jgi:hypothetical protein
MGGKILKYPGYCRSTLSNRTFYVHSLIMGREEAECTITKTIDMGPFDMRYIIRTRDLVSLCLLEEALLCPE